MCAQSVIGGIGTSSDVLSSLRRQPAFVMPVSTREQEMRRSRMFDPTVDRHGPAGAAYESIRVL